MTENSPEAEQRPDYLPDVDFKLAARMYQRMVFQHLEDLFYPKQKRDYREAKEWLYGEEDYSLDFETACEYANLLPEQIRYIADLILLGKLTQKDYKTITNS